MIIEQLKPTVLRITLHTYEIAALVSAARWVTDGAKGDLPEEAVEQIRNVIDNYDAEKQTLKR
ncbi:MAG: hypothetical protein JJU13_17910 [Balneolaceae bacterium]|nr:hypothetical protein [Balneolaceae bacterium]